MRSILAMLLTVLTVVGVSACTQKQHLSKYHAKSYDKAFAAQHAQARAGAPQGPVQGLDSQEAAIIADTYRGSLAPPGQQAEEQPVLIVAPQNRERPPMPQPSVPR